MLGTLGNKLLLDAAIRKELLGGFVIKTKTSHVQMQKLPVKINHRSPASWTAGKALTALFPWCFTDIFLCSSQTLLQLIADLALLRAKQQMALEYSRRAHK